MLSDYWGPPHLYHIVWTPKYRYRVLQGPVRQEVYNCIQVFLGQNGCEAVELNVRKRLSNRIFL